MSVTFKRTHLITVTNKALAEHEKAQAEYRKACEAYRVEHAKKAIAKTHQTAKALRDALTKALKRQGPIDAKEITRAVGRESSYYTRVDELFYTPPPIHHVQSNVDKPRGLLTQAQASEARALLKVLLAATGETVSANELKLLGLRNLTPIFAAAAAA